MNFKYGTDGLGVLRGWNNLPLRLRIKKKNDQTATVRKIIIIDIHLKDMLTFPHVSSNT